MRYEITLRFSELKLLQFIKALTLLKDNAKLTSSVKNERNVQSCNFRWCK
jgi:hypothetical protein